MAKVLLLVAAVAGGVAVARKRASGQATSALWREATQGNAKAAPRS